MLSGYDIMMVDAASDTGQVAMTELMMMLAVVVGYSSHNRTDIVCIYICNSSY